MTTERNAQGLEEVLAVIDAALADLQSRRDGDDYTHIDECARLTSEESAAVNYLRSHGAAIAELVEAAAHYEAHPYDAEGVNIAARNRLRAALRQVEGQ